MVEPTPMRSAKLGINYEAKAKQYRDHAEELRTIAGGFYLKSAQAELFSLAAKWERMAQDAEAKAIAEA